MKSTILRASKCVWILAIWSVAAPASAQSDTCAAATAIGSGTYAGSTVAATNDGAASCGTSSTSADVWFRFDATNNCRLSLDTCGSIYDTVLSVHSGCPGSPQNELTCNDDACGFGSRVTVDVTTGNSYLIRIAGWEGATGDYVLHVSCGPPPLPGADAYMGELNDLRVFGRVGDVVGCAIDTPVCNAGTEPLDWYAFPDGRHPMAVFNFYRLANGRIEQIGQSWAKHGIGAAQENGCGFGCVPNSNSNRLGVGCSDTYSASFNAERFLLGPRYEINPWTGAFAYDGSYLETHANDDFDGVQHRLQIRDSDLDPATNAGAQYVCESYAVCHDDTNHMNSLSWEPVQVSRSAGQEWVLDITAGATSNGAAILGWAGANHLVVPSSPTVDGRCILGWQTSDLGNGTWRYEYALFNLDMDRAVGSFRLPVAAQVMLTNIGFYAVASNEEGYSNAAWAVTRDATGIAWATQPYAQNPFSNPLRWGTLYNFRFDANVGPSGPGASATLGLFKPGTPETIAAAGVVVPVGGGQCVGDLDADGDVDLQDLATLLAHFGQVGGAGAVDGDTDGDADVDLPDLATLLSRFGQSCD